MMCGEVYDILYELGRSKGVIGSLVVSEDGMLIASDFKVEMEEDVVAALGANIVRHFREVLSHMDGGPFVYGFIEASGGNLLFSQIGTNILIVLTERGTNVGLARLKLEEARRKLEALFK